MSFTEVLAAARARPRAEKRRLPYAVVSERSGAKMSPTGYTAEQMEFLNRFLPPGTVIEMWSPIEAYGAAAVLEQLLKEDRASRTPRSVDHPSSTDDTGRCVQPDRPESE
jgi:hypothetical protein